MKKILTGILALVFLVCLTGCGNNQSQLSGKYVAPNSDGPLSSLVSSLEFKDDTVIITYRAGIQTSGTYTLENDGNSKILRINTDTSTDIILENFNFDDNGLSFMGGAGIWKNKEA